MFYSTIVQISVYLLPYLVKKSLGLKVNDFAVFEDSSLEKLEKTQ